MINTVFYVNGSFLGASGVKFISVSFLPFDYNIPNCNF